MSRVEAGGYGLHIQKTFSFGVESFIIYTYEYIDNTADKGLCKSIHFHYIDSYYGRRDTDFVCRLSRKRFVGPGHQHFSSSALGREHSETYEHTETESIISTVLTQITETLPKRMQHKVNVKAGVH